MRPQSLKSPPISILASRADRAGVLAIALTMALMWLIPALFLSHTFEVFPRLIDLENSSWRKFAAVVGLWLGCLAFLSGAAYWVTRSLLLSVGNDSEGADVERAAAGAEGLSERSREETAAAVEDSVRALSAAGRELTGQDVQVRAVICAQSDSQPRAPELCLLAIRLAAALVDERAVATQTISADTVPTIDLPMTEAINTGNGLNDAMWRAAVPVLCLGRARVMVAGAVEVRGAGPAPDDKIRSMLVQVALAAGMLIGELEDANGVFSASLHVPDANRTKALEMGPLTTVEIQALGLDAASLISKQAKDILMRHVSGSAKSRLIIASFLESLGSTMPHDAKRGRP